MNFVKLQREVRKGKIRPAYLLAGEEPLLGDDAQATLREAVLDGIADDFNLDRLTGRSSTPESLRDCLLTLPVMAARRLVILTEPEAARGARGKKFSQALADVLPNLCQQSETVLVVRAAKVDKRMAWVKAFKDPAAIVECAPPKGRKAILAFTRDEAERQGLSLEAGVAELLEERIGPQLLLLRQELEKASLFAGQGEKIARSHVEAGASQVAEESVWDLMDAIGEGRATPALTLLSRLASSGAAPQVVLGALAAHFRKLARLRSGETIPGPPFAARKLEKQARRYTTRRLVSCLRAIHETDTALKGAAALPSDLALERLVIGLSG